MHIYINDWNRTVCMNVLLYSHCHICDYVMVTPSARCHCRNQKVHHHLRARNRQEPGKSKKDLLHHAEDPLHPCARVSGLGMHTLIIIRCAALR